MPILRGLRASNIDDCRKHRKNQEKPQKHPRRMGICWTLNKNNILCGIQYYILCFTPTINTIYSICITIGKEKLWVNLKLSAQNVKTNTNFPYRTTIVLNAEHRLNSWCQKITRKNLNNLCFTIYFWKNIWNNNT